MGKEQSCAWDHKDGSREGLGKRPEKKDKKKDVSDQNNVRAKKPRPVVHQPPLQQPMMLVPAQPMMMAPAQPGQQPMMIERAGLVETINVAHQKLTEQSATVIEEFKQIEIALQYYLEEQDEQQGTENSQMRYIINSFSFFELMKKWSTAVSI